MGERNFANRTLYHGDNLPFLRGMNSGTVNLIATDPPFNKNRDFHADPDRLGSNARFQDRWRWDKDVHDDWLIAIQRDEPEVWTVITAAKTVWGDDMGAFLCWLGVRLLECHRLLTEDGSLYLHIDHTAHAWVKCLLDAIFGRRQFRNEIVWKRSMGAKNQAKMFHHALDTLLYYVKSETYTWNPPHLPLAKDVVDRWYRYQEPDGRRYNVADLQAPSNSGYRYEFLGAVRGWRYNPERMQQLVDEGRIVHQSITPGSKRKVAGLKRYLDESSGALLGDLWADIDMLQRSSKERTGYPTQKPLALYERIIKASSKAGDLVMDPFCGCATTPVAAGPAVGGDGHLGQGASAGA